MSKEDEIKAKVKALCIARYGDSSDESMRKLFLSYDANSNGTISNPELRALLDDAGVDFFMIPQSLVVDGVMEALDKDPTDGELTWEEYKRVPRAAPPPPAPLDKYDGPITPYGQLPAGCEAATGLCIAPASDLLTGRSQAGILSNPKGPAMVLGAGALGWFFLGPFGGIAGAAIASFFAPTPKQ